ncbi:hypothetical protein ACJMK2_020661, partial [Sinanodonta woodiana]
QVTTRGKDGEDMCNMRCVINHLVSTRSIAIRCNWDANPIHLVRQGISIAIRCNWDANPIHLVRQGISIAIRCNWDANPIHLVRQGIGIVIKDAVATAMFKTVT